VRFYICNRDWHSRAYQFLTHDDPSQEAWLKKLGLAVGGVQLQFGGIQRVSLPGSVETGSQAGANLRNVYNLPHTSRNAKHWNTMHDPFKLGDAVIRDLPHVRVTRHAPQGGRACEYRKRFKPEGLGEAAYWVQRENDFLLDFTVKRLRHTVELAAFAQGGEGQQTPVVERVATRDAGVTVEDWLRAQPRYENGVVWPHPFQHAGLFLQLLRACLAALKEIHALGIVHCDIKEDNICLPYSPYPHTPGQAIRIDFERVRLIDFAFSITPERPLAYPLPILPAAPYQSNLLKTALAADRAGKSPGRLAVQQLDYRVDLYSLGYLAGRILDAGLLQPSGFGGVAAMDGARGLVERLKSYGDGRRRGGKLMPHDDLIADIDGLLENLADMDAYRRFEVARLRESPTLGAEPGGNEDRIGPTPLTPLASPIATPPPKPTPPQSPQRLPAWLAAALLAGLGLFGYWKAVQPPPPTRPAKIEEPAAETAAPSVEAETKAKPPADAEAKKRAKLDAKRKADAEAQRQAEEAEAKADSAARAKAELAEEIRAEAAKKAKEPPASKPAPQAAAAKILSPADGGSVGRAVEISGTLEAMGDNQHAFLIIRSKAEAYGRLYYPQAELPNTAEWSLKGVFATPNYAYETFVVATDNPRSAELLRAQKSRAYGLKNLPENTKLISKIITVNRLQ